MYTASTIKEAFKTLVGWRQSYDPSVWTLGSDVTTSESGLWFNDIHPQLSIDNLMSVSPKFDDMNLNESEVNAKFTQWVLHVMEGSATQVVDEWADLKFDNRTARNLLNRNELFTNTATFDVYDENRGYLVGFEVAPCKSRSLLMKIKQVALQLEENQTLRVYLYKSGVMTALKFQDLEYTAQGGVQWFPVQDWNLKGEGSYYVVYDQSSLSNRSVNGVSDYDWQNRGFYTYPSGRYFTATAFSAKDNAVTTLWPARQNQYTIATNYGLNLSVSVECDYTDFIVEQKMLFKRAYALRVAINFMQQLYNNASARFNRNEKAMDDAKLLYQIEGDTQGRNVESLVNKYHKALAAISFDESQIDRVCLPCRKRGVTLKSFGLKRY